MIPCLWVAAGSALGGVARYGVAIAAARLWGPSFPWGTIAINVVGSFVIGFFGTLTTAEGLLPASANLRLFVMVGICGGFTTFSSFSLQTLDLARGGAWLGATGNVLLSVVLCLAAVAAGHAGAARLGTARPVAAPLSARIVAVLDRPDTARPVLAAAGLAARRIGDIRLEVLPIRHGATERFMPTEEVSTDRREAEGAGEGARRADALRRIFDEWHQQTGLGTWRASTGPARGIVPGEAGGADLLVLARPRAREDGEAHEALHAALFDARVATLLVPDGIPASLGRHVAVAWKAGAASERAVTAAMRLLVAADAVTVLVGTEQGDAQPEPTALLDRLETAGSNAELHAFAAAGRGIGRALLEEAARLGADLLVMGAYGHGPLSEFVFGGATREVLAEAAIPVLMRH